MRHNKKKDGEDEREFKKDKVIERLRESLLKKSNQPDDIVNFLKTD